MATGDSAQLLRCEAWSFMRVTWPSIDADNAEELPQIRSEDAARAIAGMAWIVER